MNQNLIFSVLMFKEQSTLKICFLQLLILVLYQWGAPKGIIIFSTLFGNFRPFSKQLLAKVLKYNEPNGAKVKMSNSKKEEYFPLLVNVFLMRTLFYNYVLKYLLNYLQTVKGQLISKCHFGVFKSSKKSTIFFQDFCPSL